MNKIMLITIKNGLSILVATLFTTISFAQNKGDNVELKGVDGKNYTGKITEISNGKYKISYDGLIFPHGLLPTNLRL